MSKLLFHFGHVLTCLGLQNGGVLGCLDGGCFHLVVDLVFLGVDGCTAECDGGTLATGAQELRGSKVSALFPWVDIVLMRGGLSTFIRSR